MSHWIFGLLKIQLLIKQDIYIKGDLLDYI